MRRNLPDGGRLRIDRQLPFLCIHRTASDEARVSKANASDHGLVTTEAAYLFASGSPAHDEGFCCLVDAIRDAMQEHFGTFLVIDVRTDRELATDFRITSPDADSIPTTLDVLETALSGIWIGGRSASVDRGTGDQVPSTASVPIPDDASLCKIDLVIKPFYRSAVNGDVYPMALQELRQQLAKAYRRTIAEFTSGSDKSKRTHHETFGPSSLVRAARLVDQQLCEVAESFDYLLQVTPTNAEPAWEHFRESGWTELPPLKYRHLPYHPNLLKRRLFAIEIERVEDPTLAHLFWEKQDEIDRQLTSLRDLHLPDSTIGDHPQQSNFLSSSLQLYGGPEKSLVELAKTILARTNTGLSNTGSTSADEDGNTPRRVTTEQLVSFARDEIDFYHTRMSEFTAKVEISDQIASGIMVSKDRLLVSNSIQLSRERVTPLLHHEIGTHLLTYFNGRCQPFRQLCSGLAGYEELQEGLAVLAEYLVGGLTLTRIRTLATRVVAIHLMVSGTPFASVFSELTERYSVAARPAFNTALRVFRGGGFTKDLVYLRGLRDLLVFLAAGHDIDPLYVGKIGLQHVPYIQELRRRGIITSPRLLPRFWDDNHVRERLDAVRGKSVLDLLETDR